MSPKLRVGTRPTHVYGALHDGLTPGGVPPVWNRNERKYTVGLVDCRLFAETLRVGWMRAESLGPKGGTRYVTTDKGKAALAEVDAEFDLKRVFYQVTGEMLSTKQFHALVALWRSHPGWSQEATVLVRLKIIGPELAARAAAPVTDIRAAWHAEFGGDPSREELSDALSMWAENPDMPLAWIVAAAKVSCAA
jgi:hypothetical protein